MKQQHILIYCINLLFSLFLCCNYSFAQNKVENKIGIQNDSTTVKEKYGIRLGIDASKLLRSFIDDDYQGLEIVADYRLTKKIYLAAEIGNEEKTTTNDFLSITAKGSYIKAGIDYNLYKNWLGMQNMIYSGFRVGTSSFSQTRNTYSVYVEDQFWEPQFSTTEALETKSLSTTWIEIQFGIKAEVLNNLYLGLNVQLKGTVAEDQPENYENLFIPGFNKTYDSGRIGVGYGYTISYRIPIIKKNR